MKTIALIAALALPLAAAAQTEAAKPPLKERAKTAVKTVTQKVVPKRIIKRLEEKKPIADETEVALSEADLRVAGQIHTGVIKCELGASVTIEADDKKPGYFTLMHAGKRYRLHPVESRTGAVRLEDPSAGAMWLQLGNKSMLMSQKQGQRLADECQAAKQIEVAEEMKKNPPKSLFDGADPPPASKQ
jgi:Ni/Co efflux regulator RcnB